MVMQVTSTDVDNVLGALLWEYANVPATPNGNSNKAKEIAYARAAGARSGIMVGIAAVATMERAKLAQRYLASGGAIEGVASWDLQKILNEFMDDFKSVRHRTEREEAVNRYVAKLQEMIADPNTLECEEYARRKLVLAGAEEPRPEDAEWLRAEAETYKALVNPYEKALQRIGASE